MLNDSKTPRVLFVDDESAMLSSIKRMSLGEKWKGYFACSAEEGLDMVREHSINVVISDMRMPGLSGADFLVQVKKEFPETQRLLMTGYSDISAVEKVVNEAGIISYISKPWDNNSFIETINSAITLQETEQLVRTRAEKNRSDRQKLGRLALNLKGLLKEKDMEARQALAALNLEHQHSNERFRSLLSAFSRAMTISEMERSHTQFLVETSIKIATKLGLDDTQIDNLLFAMQLHSVSSLVEPKKREDDSFDIQDAYQAQVEFSSKILFGLGEFSDVSDILNKYKEHLDGSGYPNKVMAQDIPIEARIMCVITEYMLLSLGERSSNIKGHKQAKSFMLQKAGQYYDSNIIDIFFNIVNENTSVENSTILSAKNSDLIPGMTLARDLLSQQGAVLLKAGTVLTEGHIQKLYSYEKSTELSLIIHIVADNRGKEVDERRSIHCTK